MDNKQIKNWLLAGLGSVCLLALWHFVSVRAGVRQTGNTWLGLWYVSLVLWGMLFLGLVGWFFLKGKLKLEQAFVCFSLCLGLMYMIVLPPLSAPDEVSHYISAYQLSSKMLGRPANAEDGRVLIRAQDAWVEDMEDVLEDDGSGQKEERAARILGQTVTQETYELLENPTEAETPQGEAVSYQFPVRTTPLAYVPQALGMAIARILGMGSLGLLFLGRIVNLLFYTAAGYLAIKRMPFGREVLFGAGLLPMTLHLAASLSYDVMILAMMSLFLAICLDLAYARERVSAKDVALLAIILAVMGPCKMVYGVAAGFCLLIPVKKFGGWGRWAASAAAVLGAFGLSMLLVNSQTVILYTSTQDRYVVWAEEAGYSMSQLLHSPLLVLRMCYDTLANQGQELFSGLFGGSLGNLDPVLNTPFIVILILALCLLILALKKPGEQVRISPCQRLWIWFLCLACLGALMFSMLLAWTPVSALVIQGVQGRYLLPLLPAFLLTLKNNRVVRTVGDDRQLLYLMAVLNVYVVLRVFSIICLRVF